MRLRCCLREPFVFPQAFGKFGNNAEVLSSLFRILGLSFFYEPRKISDPLAKKKSGERGRIRVERNGDGGITIIRAVPHCKLPTRHAIGWWQCAVVIMRLMTTHGTRRSVCAWGIVLSLKDTHAHLRTPCT